MVARNGFEFELGDKDAGAIRVRRCFGEDEGVERQIVELTFEAFTPHWFLTAIGLTPMQALEIGAALVQEGVNPIEDSQPGGNPLGLPTEPAKEYR